MTGLFNAKPAVLQTAASLLCLGMHFHAGAQAAPPVEDSPIRGYFLVDQLEHASSRYTTRKGVDAVRFNTAGWVGGDYNRIWIYTEGTKPYNRKLEDIDLQLLYGRLIAPFWDIQVGLRHSRPRSEGPSRTSAVFGFQGLAPYRFAVQAAAFVSERGDVSARAVCHRFSERVRHEALPGMQNATKHQNETTHRSRHRSA